MFLHYEYLYILQYNILFEVIPNIYTQDVRFLSKLEKFFEKNDLDFDTQTILRREITPTGKSRAFINDTPVNLKALKNLGLKLIDIHSQHQNLELSNLQFQLNLVDSVAGNQQILSDYKIQYTNFLSLKKKYLHKFQSTNLFLKN